MNVLTLTAVVFDMDGLMFNTEDLYDETGETLLQRRGQRFSRELKLKMMGLPGPAAFEVMIRHCDLDDTAEQLQRETDDIFTHLLPRKIALLPGLERLLDAIDRAGIPRAVATSSHRNFATRALGHFGLEPGFEFILTAEDVSRGKPHPEVYLLAAERLEITPDSMLVLEDSLFGSQAAVAAGAFTIAVPTLHGAHQDFSHVQHVAKRLDDHAVLNIVNNRRLEVDAEG